MLLKRVLSSAGDGFSSCLRHSLSSSFIAVISLMASPMICWRTSFSPFLTVVCPRMVRAFFNASITSSEGGAILTSLLCVQGSEVLVTFEPLSCIVSLLSFFFGCHGDIRGRAAHLSGCSGYLAAFGKGDFTIFFVVAPFLPSFGGG